MNIKENSIKSKSVSNTTKKVLNSKSKKVQKGSGFDRKSRIKNCKQEGCGGNPKTSPFAITGFIGEKCNKCFEVTNYESN